MSFDSNVFENVGIKDGNAFVLSGVGKKEGSSLWTNPFYLHQLSEPNLSQINAFRFMNCIRDSFVLPNVTKHQHVLY